MNIYSQQFLWRMANSQKSITCLNKYHLVNQGKKAFTMLKSLIKFCKFFHMNELEIAGWSLIIGKINWYKQGQDLEQFLVFTALQMKVFKII